MTTITSPGRVMPSQLTPGNRIGLERCNIRVVTSATSFDPSVAGWDAFHIAAGPKKIHRVNIWNVRQAPGPITATVDVSSANSNATEFTSILSGQSLPVGATNFSSIQHVVDIDIPGSQPVLAVLVDNPAAESLVFDVEILYTSTVVDQQIVDVDAGLGAMVQP